MTIARVPDRAVVEVVLTGIEGVTLRHAREGRLEELASLQPGLASALIQMVT